MQSAFTIHGAAGRLSIAALGSILCWSLLWSKPCAAQPFFTDVTGAMGLERDWSSRSIALGDYDNDGRLDLFFGKNGPSCCGFALLHNEGGRVADHSLLLQAIPSTWIGGGVVWGDYDNDGDQDLFVGLGMFFGDNPSRNLLFRNERGVMVEVGLEAGLTDVQPTDNALWLDYDRDGYLDLYTGNQGWISGGPGADSFRGDPTVRNKLYRNNGDGTFNDATAAAGLDKAFHPILGGTGGGMAAADFDGDGWTDLYIATLGEPNRLFLNDTRGGFRDMTAGDLADVSEAFGVAVGDMNNDGRLDIFQAAGGLTGSQRIFRSLLLLNLGAGNFLDILAGAGLQALQAINAGSPGFADVDNDGDLDLLVSSSRSLFLNTGTGFDEPAENAGLGPLFRGGSYLALGDFDGDGFVDVITESTLLRNTGNDNHHLQVDPVGTMSNRDGIGARVLTVAGGLRQVREIMGGNGFGQDPSLAHFGLGDHIRIDSLVVRWPSGQVDVWTDIPADQQIRVIEGQGTYHVVTPTIWEMPPNSLIEGASTQVEAVVRPALFSPGATITQVTADLSALGGPAALVLEGAADGTYSLKSSLTAPTQKGFYHLPIMIDQQTSLGPYWTQLSRQVAILPAADIPLFDQALAPGWSLDPNSRVTPTPTRFDGRAALALEGTGSWFLRLVADTPVDLFGFEGLSFAFHPASHTLLEGRIPRLHVLHTSTADVLAQIDLTTPAWQSVFIPIEALASDLSLPLNNLRFAGDLEGTFYLSDIRLVAREPSKSDPASAVLERHQDPKPDDFTLGQNYPNPFNSSTVILFALPTQGPVELAIYNLAGQRLVKLVDGQRPAGTHTVRWDGRDKRGRQLASGLYLYQLRAGASVQTRTLLLLR